MVASFYFVILLYASIGTLSAANAQPTGPIARFDWSLPDKFGKDRDGNGIIDFHYAWEDVYPPSDYSVNLDGCLSRSSTVENPIVAYTWRIEGNGITPRIINSLHSCNTTVPNLIQGTYSVNLTVTTQNGQRDQVSKPVTVKDILLVSIGESYASGEGNPDDPQRFDSFGFVERGPMWENRQCHRSANAGPALAALEIERSDPKTSVTFISFACSGASIREGLIGPYNGADPAITTTLPPQTWQVTRTICIIISNNDNDPVCESEFDRRVDILMISVGGNDIGFSKIIKECILSFGCNTDTRITSGVDLGLSVLPGLYDSLAADIKKRLKVSNVLITEYPDPTHNKHGVYCSAYESGPPFDQIRQDEWKWAYEKILTRLNQEIFNTAQKYERDGWEYVGEIASQFGTHGYCADDQRWFRTFVDARIIQGPFCCPWESTGTMHPRMEGQQVYKNRLVQEIKAVLEEQRMLEERQAYPAINIKVTFLNIKLTDSNTNAIASKALFAAGAQKRAYPESYGLINITSGQAINLPKGFDIASTLKGSQEFVGSVLSPFGLYQTRFPSIMGNIIPDPNAPPLTIYVGRTFDTKNNITSGTYTDNKTLVGYDPRNRPHQLTAEVTYRIIVSNTGYNLEPLNPVELIGTSQNDILRGTNDSDTMRGLEGDDKVYGFEDDDTIYGDSGLDYIYGHNGNDNIYGSDGNDFLYGGMGDDDIRGEVGDDTIYGNAGNDTINGGQGEDKLNGGAGKDIVFALDGNLDIVRCGTGSDIVENYNSPLDIIGQDCEIIRGGMD